MNLPVTEYLKKLFRDEYGLLIKSRPEPTALRFNPFKTVKSGFEEFLASKSVSFRPHPACKQGYIIDNDSLPLSHSLKFFLGHFVYQGVSSQIPALVLDPQPGETVLDMAASPGSKSTQIAALMNNKGRLFINDSSVFKLKALNANLHKFGVLNSCVTSLAGERYGSMLPEYFDKILVDAPCSALKMNPPDPDFFSDRLKNYLPTIVNVQKSLLVSALKSLKTGGTMVYSTCSMTVEENEALIDWFINNYPVTIEDTAKINVPSLREGLTGFEGKIFHGSLSKALRILPFPEPMEGFFIVKMKKTGSLPVHGYRKKFTGMKISDYSDPELRQHFDFLQEYWGIDPSFFSEWNFIIRNNKIWMTNRDPGFIPEECFCGAGIPFLTKKGDRWKLTTSAVQIMGDKITKRIIRLSNNELSELFLKKELPVNNHANGHYMIQYENIPVAQTFVVSGTMHIRLPYSFKIIL